MKENYENLEIEIITFDVDDVIEASNELPTVSGS